MLLGKLSTRVTFAFLWSQRYDTISSLTSKKTVNPPHCLVGSLLLDPSQLCFPSGSPPIYSPLTMIYSWMFCSVWAKLYVILKYEKSVCYQSHSGLALHNSVIITSLLKRKKCNFTTNTPRWFSPDSCQREGYAIFSPLPSTQASAKKHHILILFYIRIKCFLTCWSWSP